jgi:hypothetical protein
MDETLFRYSEKGSRKLSHTKHNQGGDKAGRGPAKEDWVAVIIVRDRQDNTFDKCLDSSTGEAFDHIDY